MPFFKPRAREGHGGAAPSAFTKEESTLKLAVCNEMFEGWTWEDVCKAASEHGYHGVEIAPFTFGASVRNVGTEQRGEIRRTAERYGLEVVGLHWLLAKTEGLHLTHPDASVREATSDYLTELVRFCGDVGGRVLVLGSPQQRNLRSGVDFEAALDYAAEVLQEPCDVADAAGVAIAFEPLSPAETDFINTAADARRLIERAGHPQLRLHLDAKAMASESTPMDELVRTHVDILEHVHVNDVNLLGPGMGDLDLRPLIAALKDVGYGGYLSVEVFDTKPGPERIMQESRDYLKAIL